MSQQMRGLVESLLQLARVDNGILEKLPSERIDLSKLCENESLTFEVMFFEKGLMLETKLAEDVYVKGAESYVKQVVEILLDNAQKYSDPNGTVTLGLTKDAHHCTLYVANPGDEISPENRKNIFKRFYRGDEARAMNHSYGLGLAIADDIVKGMKGRIWVDSENHLNTFKVELPLA
jgi:signal transduction histidine kinase